MIESYPVALARVLSVEGGYDAVAVMIAECSDKLVASNPQASEQQAQRRACALLLAQYRRERVRMRESVDNLASALDVRLDTLDRKHAFSVELARLVRMPEHELIARAEEVFMDLQAGMPEWWLNATL